MGVNVSKHVMPNAASRTNICMHAETILEIVESSPDGAYREVLKTIEPSVISLMQQIHSFIVKLIV